jgi:NhaP-type Na+/H+ or K+/H+ antiporter
MVYQPRFFFRIFDPAALFILLAIRPVAGLLGMAGAGLPREKNFIIACFGIRGIGSIYYLLYALYQVNIPQAKELLALTTTVVIFSVFIHGLAAKPVMRKWAPLG